MLVCKQVSQKIEKIWTETIHHWVKEAQKQCKKWPWPLSWICKVVTKLIEWIETIVHKIIQVIVTLVCYFVQAVIAVAQAVHGFFADLFWRVIGLGDFIGGLFGILPIKNLRLHVVLLRRRDGSLTAPQDRIGLAIDQTKKIFRERAKVKVHVTVHTPRQAAPPYALNVGADAQYFIDQASDAGAYFRQIIETEIPSALPAIVSRWMTPIIAFVIDNVGDTQTGCSSGPLGDYFCIEGGQMIVPPQTTPVDGNTPAQPATAVVTDAMDTMAHEMGHSCGLLHDGDDRTNLMFPSSGPGNLRGTNLSPFQRGVIRSSTHVTYT